jgi:Rieske Fe-S protein
VNINPTVTRRSLLASGAGLAGVAALAACSSTGSGSASTDQASSNPPGGQSSPATNPGSSSSSPAGSSKPLATLKDIPVGQAVSAQLPSGDPVIVSRPTATTAACFSAICTHMQCTVAPAGAKLDCPCHGSQYDALTGKVLRGPAPKPLPPVPVKVADGEVVTA